MTDDWKPIADAPKDSTRVLASWGSWVGVAFYCPAVPDWDVPDRGWRCDGDETPVHPTHFMMLPEPAKP